jgi:hypothetical protein
LVEREERVRRVEDVEEEEGAPDEKEKVGAGAERGCSPLHWRRVGF